MASPELAIAKAALAASLFRADPVSLSRPEVDTFFPILTTTLSECSRPNIQKCKVWIVDNVAHSQGRTTALAKYFAAVSKSMVKEYDGKRPSVKRRLLHLLYALSDALYHVVIRKGERSFADPWQNVLPGMFGTAAAFDKAPKHKNKLETLVGLWEEQGYFSPEIISKSRVAVTEGKAPGSNENLEPAASIKLAKDVPYNLPSFHGDHATPWYDLPAASWLQQLTPNSTKPMNPSLIRPLQLSSGPADEKLAAAVKELLSDAERIYSRDKRIEEDPSKLDLNALGERIIRDEITGDIVTGETYYGWSQAFCRRMKDQKKKIAKGSERGRSLSRSTSRSRGQSRSSSARSPKRRRVYSRSRSDSRSRSRSPRRSRSRDRSYHRDHSRSREGYNRSRTRSLSRSRSRPRDDSSTHQNTHHDNYRQQPPNFIASHNLPPQMPSGYPIPPPPPSGYQGPWPPPPPPMMHPGQMPSGWMPDPIMTPHMAGHWGSGPPPPPPPPANNSYGRYNGGPRGQGRGGGFPRGGRGRGW